jgi:hypothetical protein
VVASRRLAEQPQPGVAGMAQGQPAAGVAPATGGPEQPDEIVTEAENAEKTQEDPDEISGSGP